MNYIIFDLEWNNAYNHAIKGFMNEIIEIGAVKLDERLRIVDTFKQLIKPKFSKKLSQRCKNLTKITNEELRDNGIPFENAIRDFARWSEGEKSIFLSWSNSDLYVLINNYRQFVGTFDISFIKAYCDAQKYCMSFIERENNNQISLAACSEIFNIDVDMTKLHRALADCYLTAECLRKVFDAEKIRSYISSCDKSFFERLMYKPYLITKPKSDIYNAYEELIECPVCKEPMQMLRDFETVNKSFKCPAKCHKCRKTYWVTIRAKKTYDCIEVSVSTVLMNGKKARKLRRSCQDNTNS